jgi:hypothetical protein
MKLAIVLSALITSSASADAVFRIADGLWVWSGALGTGMAANLGNGTWVGSGWDAFPGVSPPWNPVVAPPAQIIVPVIVAPSPGVVTIGMPPPPATRTLYLSINGETVPFVTNQ